VRYTLLIDCSDEVGLVYKVTKVLFELKANIEKNSEFVDKDNNKFFMRTEFNASLESVNLVELLKETLPKDSKIKLTKARKKNIVILATKETHCLGDILMRYYSDELNANIKGIVSNYEILKPLADKFHIPFYTVSHLDLSRSEHEERVLEVLDDIGEVDYLVLAKYMRILSANFVDKYEQKIINIHHSFLPAFIGANPYKQAFERGVKIIGATAHFVNNNLDEGPIIAQSIREVNHNYSWRDMQSAGKDVEKIVLAKALNLTFEDRIFVYANKTIIL
jgi:formyltetrahydrofolate deformylase